MLLGRWLIEGLHVPWQGRQPFFSPAPVWNKINFVQFLFAIVFNNILIIIIFYALFYHMRKYNHFIFFICMNDIQGYSLWYKNLYYNQFSIQVTKKIMKTVEFIYQLSISIMTLVTNYHHTHFFISTRKPNY
jgi:nicotinamide riboside transporter PnuC